MLSTHRISRLVYKIVSERSQQHQSSHSLSVDNNRKILKDNSEGIFCWKVVLQQFKDSTREEIVPVIEKKIQKIILI